MKSTFESRTFDSGVCTDEPDWVQCLRRMKQRHGSIKHPAPHAEQRLGGQQGLATPPHSPIWALFYINPQGFPPFVCQTKVPKMN